MNEPALPAVVDVIPHRAPFLYLDSCLSCTQLAVIGQRYFPENESFFSGHFPDRPIVPGVILIEGLAQTLAYLALQQTQAKTVLLAGVDQCRIRQPVYPNQTVHYHVTIERVRTNWVFAQGEVRRDETIVLSAKLKGFIPHSTPND